MLRFSAIQVARLAPHEMRFFLYFWGVFEDYFLAVQMLYLSEREKMNGKNLIEFELGFALPCDEVVDIFLFFLLLCLVSCGCILVLTVCGCYMGWEG